MEEQAADLGRRLARYYGHGTDVEYIDVFSPRMEEFPLAHRAVFMMNVNLPVIAFDGQPRIAGGMQRADLTRQIVDAQTIDPKVDFSDKRDPDWPTSPAPGRAWTPSIMSSRPSRTLPRTATAPRPRSATTGIS